MLSLLHKMIFSTTREPIAHSSSSQQTVPQSIFTHLLAIEYPKILGHANCFKEADASENLAAQNENERILCQQLIQNTEIREFLMHAIYPDNQFNFIQPNPISQPPLITFGALKQLLKICNEIQQQTILPSLNSDVIACVCKICSNEELCQISSRISTPLPRSKIGTCGYMGARIQPNSPTDNPIDIIWQVFNGFSYAVGDVLLGTNPVSSRKQDVRAIELALKDLIKTFKLEKILPYCVLSHIDIQAEIEEESPETTALWFQSIAGVDAANKTFDLSIEKLKKYANRRKGQFSFYFETGQGADVTNGHGFGFDTLLHESRKYGLARKLKEFITATEPWVIVNDVAGFIGPEVFRTKEQLVRCCLEDTFMAKLHQLTCGLDICTTLHQDISLEDLDWCLDHIMPANPGYIMALPTKNDPMLSYLTTSFQDHVRIRNKFGYKVNDQMWDFFKKLEVIDDFGQPTEHFGQPKWVYYKFKQLQGDKREEQEILQEAETQLEQVRARGVYIAEGYGENPWDMDQALSNHIKELYLDAKKCIWNELPENFQDTLPMKSIKLITKSISREDFILHPTTGESLNGESLDKLNKFVHNGFDEKCDAQIVISDGLCANSITDNNHLIPYLKALQEKLQQNGFSFNQQALIVQYGRVRVGYRIGEILFSQVKEQKQQNKNKILIHIIGERPGSGHHAFSVYLTAPRINEWQNTIIDHDSTKVVSGIADTQFYPTDAADITVKILKEMVL